MAIVMIVTNFCAFGAIELGAATTDTRYSKKYLQNGGFEENVENYKFSSYYTQPIKSNVPYWDTTAYGINGGNGMLEFFKAGAAHFNQSSAVNKVVAQGEVAAELNADEVSTIYQRIETVSGSTYTWGLDHRGRDTTDTMVLFIGPEQYDESGNVIDPSKPSKTGKDQFVKMTDWLKTQYGISYPAKGCSQKYTIYSKPFAAKGAFQNESTNANENFSMTQTDECNQEWNLWVISSEYENKDPDPTKAIKGWSKYGTNRYDENDDSYNDVINGVNSKLGYDCTYTVPKGQTKTLFAFTSYSGGRLSNKDIIYDATFGNLLDDINFKLYQPISSSITEGGNGGVHTGNATITSDIQNGNLFYTTVTDGELCTIRTMRLNESDTFEFQGAYVTVYKDDGTPVTRYIPIYKGDIYGLTKEQKLALSKDYFLVDGTKTTEADGTEKTWDYYFNVSVESPVHIHMMYSKAPYVLYDSNGGEPYRWVLDNSGGGNLIGFRDNFQTVEGLVGTGSYYQNCIVKENTTTSGLEVEQPGFYKSHDAVPNKNWNTNIFGVGSRFLGWAIKDSSNDNKLVILNGKHKVTYNPKPDKLGHVTFNNLDENGEIIKDGAVAGLELDATHGVTLTAQWQFGYTAQAQTLNLNSETPAYENSDVGGWVEETFIDKKSGNVTDYKDAYTPNRTERTDAYGAVGEKIIFRATPDVDHNYAFVGWYTIDGVGENKTETLITNSPNLAVTVEEGKSQTYYARFRVKSVPVVFHYSPSGSKDDYVYYDANDENKFGKYFQNVYYEDKAVKPTGDSQSVTKWYTSPTERGSEYVFDFNTPITKETHLYASPSFAISYYTFFRFNEPWEVKYYATLKFDGKYIDVKNDTNLTDYNIYTVKANAGESISLASSLKKDDRVDKVGKKINSSQLLFDKTTNTGNTFNRCGIKFNSFYLYDMNHPVYVVFDFTYKGITYTSGIKNRSLDQNISTYMTTENGLFTTLPTTEQAELRTAQTEMLQSIQAMNKAVSWDGKNKTEYPNGSAINPSDFTNTNSEPDSSITDTEVAARYIEPWGYQFIFDITTPDGVSKSDLEDYGAIVLTDKSNTYTEAPTVQELINNSNTLVYSKKNSSVSDHKGNDGNSTGKLCAYHINNLRATDFDKNTYVVFYYKAKDSDYHYSEVKSCSYNSYADAEHSDAISAIKNFSQKLINYYQVKKNAGINN